MDNFVSIIGKVYEIYPKRTSDGTAVLNLRVGVKENSKANLTMVDVTMWGAAAEKAQVAIEKNSFCLFMGTLKRDSWESDGQKRTKLYVKANRFAVMGSAADFANATQDDGVENVAKKPPYVAPKPVKTNIEPENVDEDDVPF